MEGTDLEKPAGEWEVYKDAFAPPPSRTIRAWERAPVSAHAPRLQGQKIWKRAGAKTQRDDEGGKDNFEAAQDELLRDGTGARKRARARGGNENIGDATWKEDAANQELPEVGTKVVPGGDMALPLSDMDSNAFQYVPRKRTGANHVITPRKQGKRMGHGMKETLSAKEVQSPEKPRRRKSMRKSLRMSAVGSLTAVSAPASEDSTIVEFGAAAFPRAASMNIKSDGSATQSTQAVSIPEPTPDSDAVSTLNKRLNGLFDFTEGEKATARRPKQIAGDETGTLVDSMPVSKPTIKIPLNDVDNLTDDEETNVENDEQASRGREDSEVQSAILQSIETDAAEVSAPMPTKTRPSTKKRESNQRRGTRRSNRTTRASSVQREEQAAPATESSENQPSSEARSQLTDDDPAVVEFQVADTTAESDPITLREQEPENRVAEDIAEKDNKGCLDDSGPTTRPQQPDLYSFDVSARHILERPTIKPEDIPSREDFKVPPTSTKVEATSVTASSEQLRSETSALETGSIAEPRECKSSPVRVSPAGDESTETLVKSEEFTVEALETFEPVSTPHSEIIGIGDEILSPPIENPPDTSTPDPTTSALVEAISENATSASYEHDETDLLRNFLTRVKADKAAKAGTSIPRRKRSLPHSPIQLPFGGADADMSPDQKTKIEFEIDQPGPSPSKRQKRSNPLDVPVDEKPTRRSGRTRLPVIKAPLGAPSYIPVRRLGQDGDTTVTLRRNEDKELAALTRVNTRKNKGAALSVPEFLIKKADEKEDPVLRQRSLKEIFDEKGSQKAKKEKRKTVVWAEELTQYQTVEARKVDGEKEKEIELTRSATVEEKNRPVKVGLRSKMALGMAANGTPAPKRKRSRV